MGSSLVRIAEAANSLFLLDVEAPMKLQQPSELELARQSEFAVTSLDAVGRAIGALFRLHVRDAIERSRVARQRATDPDLVPMAVGFVDLVGFTPLTAASSTRELIALVVNFESRAYDIVNEHGGRLVKLIGDEVMFTTIDPIDAVTIVKSMFVALGESTAVAPRAGIAYGDTLAHGGDYYGPVVNLASRVADIAVPWEILVTDDVASRVRAIHELAPAGRRQLKGFADPVSLHEVRR
jgi:adenylate cyclase